MSESQEKAPEETAYFSGGPKSGETMQILAGTEVLRFRRERSFRAEYDRFDVSRDSVTYRRSDDGMMGGARIYIYAGYHEEG